MQYNWNISKNRKVEVKLRKKNMQHIAMTMPHVRYICVLYTPNVSLAS
jgi:hypothetical protein